MRSTKIVLAVLVAVLLFAFLLPHSIVSPIPKAHAVTKSITLYAYLAGWNSSQASGANPTIAVNQGDTISFNLVNPDTIPHLLLVDFDKTGVMPCSGTGLNKCSGNLSPSGGTGSIPAFTVTANPGQYSYYCLYHSPAYMTGTLMVQGFSVSASPSSLPINQGTNANSTLSVASLSGFSGQVTLSATQPASWPAPFLSSKSVTVSSGMTSMSKLTVYVPSGATPGPYTVTVTASDSSISHSTDISVTVPSPSFSVTSSPGALTISSGAIGQSTVTITGSGGFSGTVTLSASAPAGRAITTLSSTSFTLSSAKTSATSTLNITSSLGTFNVTLTATSGATTHSSTVLVNGPDFSIAVSPTSLSVGQGSSATLTLTLSSVNGFSGPVSLIVSSNGGPPVSVSPSSLQVAAAGTTSSTLTVTALSSGTYSTPVSPGSYTITLNATMGSLSHVASIPLTVTSPGFGAGFLTNPLFIGGIIGAVVIVGVAIYVLSRRPKKPNVR